MFASQKREVKLSPPKTEFHDQVNDWLLYPKLYSLSYPSPVPLKIEKYLKKGDIKKKQDPVGPSHVKSILLVK